MSEVKNTVPQEAGKPPVPPQGAPSGQKGPGGREMSADELRQLSQKNGAPMNRGPGGRGGPMIREKPKNAKATIVKLIRYIAKSRYLILVILLTTLATTGLNLLGPLLQGKAIDTITLGEGRLHVDFEALIRYRLQIAHRLLNETNLTLQEISFECGFHSVNYFSRQFRKNYGCAPGNCRLLGK